MKADTIKVLHHDVEIEYRERENKWVFTLRGRERSTDTLAKAREAIDAPPPKDKKPFPRTKVYTNNYGEGWQVAEVTSIADGPLWRSDVEFWISCGKYRRKESRHNLYAWNSANSERVEQITKLKAGRSQIDEQITAIEQKMDKFKLPENCE